LAATTLVTATWKGSILASPFSPRDLRAYALLGLQAMEKEREREKATHEPAAEGPNSRFIGMAGGHGQLTGLLFYFFNIFNLFYFFVLNLKINLCVMG